MRQDNPFKDAMRIAENDLAYVIWDGFPVTEGHTLIVPKREGATLSDLSDEELLSCFSLLREAAAKAESDGYNVGINQGKAAGQTIAQLHFHMIPRRSGDTQNPRGGIRHVIPGRGDYQE